LTSRSRFPRVRGEGGSFISPILLVSGHRRALRQLGNQGFPDVDRLSAVTPRPTHRCIPYKPWYRQSANLSRHLQHADSALLSAISAHSQTTAASQACAALRSACFDSESKHNPLPDLSPHVRWLASSKRHLSHPSLYTAQFALIGPPRRSATAGLPPVAHISGKSRMAASSHYFKISGLHDRLSERRTYRPLTFSIGRYQPCSLARLRA